MTETKQKGQPRTTAFVVGAVFAALAAWSFFHRNRLLLAGVAGGLAAVLFLVGLFSPSLAARFDRAWTRLATMLGYINSCLLLSTVFSLMVMPVGILMRFFGRDPLRRRSPQQGGYWIPRSASRQTKQGFERAY